MKWMKLWDEKSNQLIREKKNQPMSYRKVISQWARKRLTSQCTCITTTCQCNLERVGNS